MVAIFYGEYFKKGIKSVIVKEEEYEDKLSELLWNEAIIVHIARV